MQTLQKLLKKARFFIIDLIEKVQNMVVDDHGCPKNRDFVEPKEEEEIWICSSYQIRHKTILSFVERRAK